MKTLYGVSAISVHYCIRSSKTEICRADAGICEYKGSIDRLRIQAEVAAPYQLSKRSRDRRGVRETTHPDWQQTTHFAQ